MERFAVPIAQQQQEVVAIVQQQQDLARCRSMQTAAEGHQILHGIVAALACQRCKICCVSQSLASVHAMAETEGYVLRLQLPVVAVTNLTHASLGISRLKLA